MALSLSLDSRTSSVNRASEGEFPAAWYTESACGRRRSEVMVDKERLREQKL